MTRTTPSGQKKFTIYGKHLMIDGYGISPKKLADAKGIYDLLCVLPERLNMKRLTTPYVAYDDWQMGRAKEDWGVSGFVMIYESHISCHTWPAIGYVSMDVYSCRPFEHEKVVSYLKAFWGARRFRARVIRRG